MRAHPQYDGLEALHEKLADKGFSVLGFQPMISARRNRQQWRECRILRTNFSVSFPMFEKIAVTGDEKHPLYAALTSAKPDTDNDASPFRERLKGFGMTPNEAPEILWNFEKFLIARDGAVSGVGRFAPTTAPNDAEMLAAIEAQLAA